MADALEYIEIHWKTLEYSELAMKLLVQGLCRGQRGRPAMSLMSDSITLLNEHLGGYKTAHCTVCGSVAFN